MNPSTSYLIGLPIAGVPRLQSSNRKSPAVNCKAYPWIAEMEVIIQLNGMRVSGVCELLSSGSKMCGDDIASQAVSHILTEVLHQALTYLYQPIWLTNMKCSICHNGTQDMWWRFSSTHECSWIMYHDSVNIEMCTRPEGSGALLIRNWQVIWSPLLSQVLYCN